MGNSKRIVILILIIGSILKLNAQEETHESKHGEEKDPGLEAVISGLVMYTPDEGLYVPTTELHLTYWFTHKWALGVGYSILFEEEQRINHEIAPLLSYKPWTWLTVNSGPSFALPNSEADLEVSAYFEGEFNFEVGGFHSGPVIGTLVGEEFRLFAGVHVGYDF